MARVKGVSGKFIKHKDIKKEVLEELDKFNACTIEAYSKFREFHYSFSHKDGLYSIYIQYRLNGRFNTMSLQNIEENTFFNILDDIQKDAVDIFLLDGYQ